jgi:hypothetical protein
MLQAQLVGSPGLGFTLSSRGSAIYADPDEKARFEMLQRAINKFYKKFAPSVRPLTVDAKLGKKTLAYRNAIFAYAERATSTPFGRNYTAETRSDMARMAGLDAAMIGGAAVQALAFIPALASTLFGPLVTVLEAVLPERYTPAIPPLPAAPPDLPDLSRILVEDFEEPANLPPTPPVVVVPNKPPIATKDPGGKPFKHPGGGVPYALLAGGGAIVLLGLGVLWYRRTH